MTDNEFWISVWKTVGYVIVAVTVAGIASCQSTNDKVLKAIEAGATPMEARCAISDVNGVIDGYICMEVTRSAR